MIFKISMINLLKHKVYPLINVFWFAIGFTAFILRALFIRYDLNWDKSNKEYLPTAMGLSAEHHNYCGNCFFDNKLSNDISSEKKSGGGAEI